MSTLQDFIRRGGRLAARELVTAQDATLWNAWRQQTDMFGDQVARRVNLATQSMQKLDLRGYDLTNINGIKSDFSGCILSDVNCSYSDFFEANLIECRLDGVNFRHARLARAYLREADLSRADLRDCDLRRASLTDARLVQANLCGCDLSATRGLLQDQLEDAVGDRKTKLPSHLLMPAAWAVYDAEPPIESDDIERLRALPATVEVAVISGRVQLSSDPGNAYFAGTTAVEPLLAEIMSDLERIKSRCSNVRELRLAIDAYLDEANRAEYDIILLGMRGIKLQTILEAVDNGGDTAELLPDAVGALRAVIIQHQLFIGQSHKWKRFLEAVSEWVEWPRLG